MLDKFTFFVSWGMVGASSVYLIGLTVRSFPSVHPWVYFSLLALAVIFGILLSTKRQEFVGPVLAVMFFGIFGAILAGV